MPETLPSQLTGAFGKPFPEQVAFFRQKLGRLVPTARWTDLMQAEHDRAFMVAGASKAALLEDLAAAIDRAIAEGASLDEFRRDFKAAVQAHGWTQWTGAGSPTGEAWRTRIIYSTNTSTAYAAGRLAQLRAAGFAYWVYRHSDSVLHPRPMHLAWNGLTLAPDHPFWRTHYPPNGWGCRCYVLGARDAAAARRLGGDPGKALPAGWNARNAKTGAPPGIDRGWGYQPGDTVSETVTALAGALDRLPARPAIALIQDWLRTELFARWFAQPQGRFPLVRLPDADAQALGAPPTVRVGYLSADSAGKQAVAHPELTPIDYAQAQRVIDSASVKVLETQPTGTRDMIYVLVEEPSGYVLVVKATRTGNELFVKTFYRLHRDEARRDREVMRLLRKGNAM